MKSGSPKKRLTIIKTRRFILRPYRKKDLKSIAKHINDKTIANNTLTIPYPYTTKDAEEWYRNYRNLIRRTTIKRVIFVIEIDNQAVGSIGISLPRRDSHKAEIGYWLGRAYWGMGIMTAVVREITRFAFDDLGLSRVHAYVFPDNKASMSVLEKAGYKFEGILRKNVRKGNKLFDECLFVRTR